MRNKTLIALAACSAMLLGGCSTSAADGAQIIKPANIDDVSYAFNDEARAELIEGFGEGAAPKLFAKVGQEMPSLELEGYDGEKFNLQDYKGQNVIVELMAYWCGYCQEESRAYLDDIINANPDVQVIQVFVEGSKTTDDGEGEYDAIAKFYEEVGKSPEGKKIAMESEAVTDYIVNNLGIQGFPSFVFYDSDGRLSWAHEGLLTADTVADIKGRAFGDEPRIYNMLADGIESAADYARDIAAVKADLTDEAVERVKGLIGDDQYSEETTYANIGRKVESDQKLIDLQNEVLDMGALQGVTVYTFLAESSEHTADEIAALNEFAGSVKGKVNFVTILIPDVTQDTATWLKGMETKPVGYIFDSYGSFPEVLYPTILYYAPTTLYVNEAEHVVTGAWHANTFDLETMNKAYEIFNGKGAVYKALR